MRFRFLEFRLASVPAGTRNFRVPASVAKVFLQVLPKLTLILEFRCLVLLAKVFLQ